MIEYDPQTSGTQYLEDLATAYWQSETLFTALEMGIFARLEPHGLSAGQLAGILGCDESGLIRFLNALCALGLVGRCCETYFNGAVSRAHLLPGKPGYQGDSILWRKYLGGGWRKLGDGVRAGGRTVFGESEDADDGSLGVRRRKYILAMDAVARSKASELIPFFPGFPEGAKLLDVGAGSGAISAGFLEAFPNLDATLVDIEGVLDIARELTARRGHTKRTAFVPANILEPWRLGGDAFDLIIMSNILHAFAEPEVEFVLDQAVYHLKSGGFMLIHDFFLEHNAPKAALFDINMMINTYNGKVFSADYIIKRLTARGLEATKLLPLGTDTGVILACGDARDLNGLSVSGVSQAASKIREIGFTGITELDMKDIVVSEWPGLKCRYGCSNYGHKYCPPNTPGPDKMEKILSEYKTALLIEGQPPTLDFQTRLLRAERAALAAGFYKALAFWAGPCSLCEACTFERGCSRPDDARLSMEGAGIDVFETVKRAGKVLKTVSSEGFVKYFGLLLLE